LATTARIAQRLLANPAARIHYAPHFPQRISRAACMSRASRVFVLGDTQVCESTACLEE